MSSVTRRIGLSREKPQRASKILQSEGARSLRHRFEFLIGFRGDQALETLNDLRFPQSQIVQGFDERHQNNFVPRPAFANANPYFALEKSLKPFRGPEAASYALCVQKKRRPLFRTPL